LAVHQATVRPGRRAIAAIAIIGALTVLAGHTQQAYLTFICAGLAGLIALRRHLVRHRWHAVGLAVGSWAGGIGMGAGVAAAQLLPTAGQSSVSDRHGGIGPAPVAGPPAARYGTVANHHSHYPR